MVHYDFFKVNILSICFDVPICGISFFEDLGTIFFFKCCFQVPSKFLKNRWHLTPVSACLWNICSRKIKVSSLLNVLNIIDFTSHWSLIRSVPSSNAVTHNVICDIMWMVRVVTECATHWYWVSIEKTRLNFFGFMVLPIVLWNCWKGKNRP